MNKVLTTIIFLFLLSGCIAHVTPEGTYLEPLPLLVAIEPPIIVEPPHHISLRPLPPVVLMPDRYIYSHNNLYYYYWDNSWYYSERQKGPWHKMPREYYPKQYRDNRGRDSERDRYRDRYRDRDGDNRDRDRRY
jgi:hypothetical protein